MLGEIDIVIDSTHGYIKDKQGNIYLFSNMDILDDTEVKIGVKVEFKPIMDKVLRATYISKIDTF